MILKHGPRNVCHVGKLAELLKKCCFVNGVTNIKADFVVVFIILPVELDGIGNGFGYF